MTHQWAELTSPQLAGRLAADPECVALIPVGATEQHGPHLPVGTDTIIATALADAAAGDAAVVLPPLPFGASYFHGTRLAGTVAFSGEETAAAAGLVAEACVDSGFRRLLFSTVTWATRPRCGSPATASGASFPTCGSGSCSGEI